MERGLGFCPNQGGIGDDIKCRFPPMSGALHTLPHLTGALTDRHSCEQNPHLKPVWLIRIPWDIDTEFIDDEFDPRNPTQLAPSFTQWVS